MDRKTLNALKGSIMKWNNICMGCERDKGTENCPLCKKFYYSVCHLCPVKEKTRVSDCIGTPYWGFVEEGGRNTQASVDSAYYAERMLVYLLELLPAKHPWRKMI